jgi:FO synthase
MKLRSVLRECVDGKVPTLSEAMLLAAARGDDFDRLLDSASRLRDAYKGRTITFSPKAFIPLTNLCRDFCSYCTFRKAPAEAGAKTMTIDEVLQVVRRAKALGCTEVLFSLGDKPEAIYPEMRMLLVQTGFRRTLEYLYAACAAVVEETGLLPHSNAGLMGRADLKQLREVNVSLGLMLESTSARLGLAGGPHFNAPDKIPALRLRTIAEAGRLGIAFTTGILIGIGETWQERIDSLFAIRALQERFGHVQEVIIQNFLSKPETPMGQHAQPSLREMLKTIALARLILGGRMNIQAPPNLNLESYESYLYAGINDWGGVSPLTPDYINPEAPWPTLTKLREKTRMAGFDLKARLPLYPEFIAQGDRFIAPKLLPYVERLSGADHFATTGGLYDRCGAALQL